MIGCWLIVYVLLILYWSCNLPILIYYLWFIDLFLIFCWSSIDPLLMCLFSLYWPSTGPTIDPWVICHWSSVNWLLILYLWLLITHLFDFLGIHCFLVWWWNLSIKLHSHAAQTTTFMNFHLMLSFQCLMFSQRFASDELTNGGTTFQSTMCVIKVVADSPQLWIYYL